MPFKDMRQFMDLLSRTGELKICDKEVDPYIEINKVTDKSSKVEGPAILFNRVKGFDTPVVTGLFGTIDRSYLAIEARKYDAFKRMANGYDNPIPYKKVKDGPCKEVINVKERVDLNELPALWHHAKDSHKFITANVCRSKDPDTGIGNNSINRVAVQGKAKLTIQSVIPHQLRMSAFKYLAKGKACPVAIAVGTDPAIFACAACGLPYNVDETDFAGGITGEPVEMVKCETIDLDVPATAELVIEGEFRPGSSDGYIGKSDYASEAPFGEISGYFGAQTLSPILHITAITRRKNYIYQGLGTAEPPSEHQILQCFAGQGNAYMLARAVIPAENIVAINPLIGAAGFAAVISIKKNSPGQARQIIYSLLTKTSFKKIIVVDEDIDVFNPVFVDWAVCFRASAEDYIITAEIPGVSLDPMVTTPPNLMRKIGIDATLPLNGDKKGRMEILRDLGPARYTDLDKVNLEHYIAAVSG